MQIKVAKKERALNKTERGEWRERPETATCEFDRTTACKGGKMRCTHGSIECGATAALCKKKLSTSHASLLNYLPVYDSCAAATSTCLHHRHHWACLHSSTMPLFRIIPPSPPLPSPSPKDGETSRSHRRLDSPPILFRSTAFERSMQALHFHVHAISICIL